MSMKHETLDVLWFEYCRRHRKLLESLTPDGKTLPRERRSLWRHKIEEIQASLDKPQTVGDLKIMLGDHPEWWLVKVVKNRIMVENPEPLPQAPRKKTRRKK